MINNIISVFSWSVDIATIGLSFGACFTASIYISLCATRLVALTPRIGVAVLRS